MHNIRFLDILKSPNAILIVLVLALVAQIPHAADVFRLIGHSEGTWANIHSYFFAVALELAVLMFVVQNRQNESYGFAVVSVAMNLSYYFLNNVPLFSFAALPSWLVSVALPAAIALYSHVVVEAQPQAEQMPVKRTRTVKVTRTDEQSEQYTIVQPEQLPVVEVEQSTAIVPDTDEQKRAALAEMLRTGQTVNKSKLSREWQVGRTTLYTWIAEMEAAHGS